MMRVKLNTIYASPTRNLDAGTVAEFPEAEARALIAGGFAVAVDPAPARPEPVVETATAPGHVETATAPHARPRKPRG